MNWLKSNPGMGILIITIFMRVGSAPTAAASYVFLAFYALGGRANVIRSFVLLWVFTLLNSELVVRSSFGSTGRYLILLCGAFSMIYRSFGKSERSFFSGTLMLHTILVGVFIIFHSTLLSPNLDVSLLKSVSWLMTVTTLMSAWGGLSPEARRGMVMEFYYFFIVVMVVSIPLMFLPQGYTVNGTGFQGFLNHPQSFGPAMGLLGSWAAASVLSNKKLNMRDVLVLGFCMVMVIKSEARTAGLAMILAVLLAGLSELFVSRQKLKKALPGLYNQKVFLCSVAAVVLILANAGAVQGILHDYLNKREQSSGSLQSAYQGSRGELLQKMWDNIDKNPWGGVGFGIASRADEVVIQRDPVFGLPVSATIEKGVMPVAILEELGIPGFFIIFTWFARILWRSARSLSFIPLCLLFNALLQNMAENTLFSPGGYGLILIVIVAWAATVPSRKAAGVANA